MHGVMKRHEVQVLIEAGLTAAQAAAASGVSERSVWRIAKESPATDTADGAAARERGVGRPSKTREFREFVVETLKDEPDLPAVELLHRARGRGYDGGKSAFYSMVADVRPSDTSPMVRFEGLPGEFSQHDFGHVDVRYVGGGKERIRFFASRLKYSRWSEVRLVPDETVESLVRAMLSSFEAWGGVPLVAVFDNPKTVVLRRRGTKIEWNQTFGQVALDYRFGPELCAPRRANQKGSVENLVGWVKGSFFKVRRFHDRADLERQLAEWHREVNHERPSRATDVTPAERMKVEAERLRSLAISASQYPLRFPVVVGPTATVQHGGVSYSMPPESIGFPATLYLYPDRVRIIARRYEAEHPRGELGAGGSVLPEHRAAMLASVSGKRARLYYKRQQLLDLGMSAEALLTEIVHRHPRTWPGEVEILFDLLQDFGGERLRRALERAVQERRFAAYHVVELLKEGVA